MIFIVCAGLFLSWATPVAEAQPAGRVVVPTSGRVLRLTLGMKDREPTDWNGSITLNPGTVSVVTLQPANAGSVDGSSWQAKTRKPAKRKQKSVHDPKLPALTRPVVLATVSGPAEAQVQVTLQQGEFSFALSQLSQGAATAYLAGQVRVELLPATVRLTRAVGDEDLPAAARGADGSIWMAYLAYRPAPALNAGLIHKTKEFASLRPAGHGDRLQLMRFDGESWGKPIPVTQPGLDLWRPTVTVDKGGTVWVIWSQNVEHNWDLYARGYEPRSGRWTAARRVTTAAGTDMNPVAVADPNADRVYITWQGWREGSFDILLTTLDGRETTAERTLAGGPANQWSPAATIDSQGALHVAYDTYENENYDVMLISDAASSRSRPLAVAASAGYEARPSIAVDKDDRIWVAYEQDGANWGKDTGMGWRGRRGQLLYFQREVMVRVVQQGKIRQVAGLVPSNPINRNYPDAKTRRLSMPRLAVDARGRLWLLVRRHPNDSGGGERWASFVTHHTGQGWAQPVQLAHSENLMDNRPALIPLPDEGLLVVHSCDGRTGGTQSAKQNDLYCSVARTGQAVQVPNLVAPTDSHERAEAVHPREQEDVRRMRAYRAEIGGKNYQLLRGEFHRHTELTSHRDQDGTLEEMWRYALDAARMDWIGNGDHDNGYGVQYLWWLVQKQTDMYHHAPYFTPMFTYERSVTYPSGHRNAMFAERGIRPLPRIPGGKVPLYGTPEKGSPDIKTFYAYLRHFNGICASHTSGTNMGTDWRDHDPEVEPIVEIYQGLRQSYEHLGAPATARDAKDSIGGYRPDGFIWNALRKGYRLGFEVSSDHYSTHISYAVVYAEEPTREGILKAFKQRHSYGANDNIVLDVRCGQQMMGDAFSVQGKPRIKITAIGTEPIGRLSIIRGTGDQSPKYVYNAAPNQQRVQLEWTDEQPVWGQTSYYYVRLEQVSPPGGYGALAWASPMWIDVRQ